MSMLAMARRSWVLLGFIAGCGPATQGLADGSETGTADETATSGSETGETGGTGGGETGDGGTESGEESGPGEACGDGVLQAGEACDGDDFGGQTCQDLGFVGGELSCTGQCTIDATGCADELCGNNVIEGSEECDGADFGGLNCTDLGFGPGLPLCTESCTFDTSTCATLGEGDPCDDLFNPCKGGLNCVDGTCHDGSVGDPCGDNGDCQTRDCVGETLFDPGECA